MSDPLDVIAAIVDGHRLVTRSREPESSTAVCLPADCGWESERSHAAAHARHVAEVIRDALAPERVQWSLHQGAGISFGNEAPCRQIRAVGGGTLRRRTARYWPGEIGEWEDVP